MSGKKIVQELTEEQLVQIATEMPGEVVMDAISDAARMIYDLGIKHGKDRISTQLIYYHYKQWKGLLNKRLSRAEFFRDFKKYFDQHRDKDGTYYELNAKSFDTTEETKWLVRKAIRDAKYNEQKKKRRKKTLPSTS